MRNIALFTVVLFFSLFANGQHKGREACKHHKKGASTAAYYNYENLKSDTVDILHYGIHLDVTNFSGKSISGYTSIKFKALRDNVTTISLDLHELNVDSVTSSSTHSYAYNDTLLLVNLGTSLNANDSMTLNVFYHGQPKLDPTGWGGFYFTGDYAFNLGVGFAAKPHNLGRYWFPCFDNFKERAQIDFYITAPAGKVAVANGALETDSTLSNGNSFRHWKITEPIPTYLTMIAVAPYTTVKDVFNGTHGSTPIELYAVKSDTNNLKVSFQNLQSALSTFEDGYGKYRFNKIGYSLVPFNGGAMEHASNITYPRSSANGTTSDETLMAHELAHQWWGNTATCLTPEDMWLNEGMASYSEYLFLEKAYDWEAARLEVVKTNLAVIRKAHIDEGGYLAVSGVSHENTYGMHVYDKGSLVAQNLRQYLGDSLFFNGLTDFLNHNEFDNMSSESLRDHLTNFTGYDVGHFFTPWVFNGGFPDFTIDSTQITPTTGLYEIDVFVQQKLRGAPQYFTNVPLEVTFFDNNWQTSTHTIRVDGKLDTAHFQLPFAPIYTTLNYHNKLCYATTDNTKIIKTTGNQSFSNALWNVNVSQVSDSVLLRIEHHWTAPDPIKEYNNKAYKLSDYRYWRVSGILKGSFNAKVQFNYDGRAAGGYLDSSLVNITEDSLVLLYRASPAEDWEEYAHYSKNQVGSVHNMFGQITMNTLLMGEYTLANKDYSVLSTPQSTAIESTLKVYPNPADTDLTFESSGYPIEIIEIYDTTGKQIARHKIQGHSTYSINTQNMASGNYIYKAYRKGEILSGKFIVQ